MYQHKYFNLCLHEDEELADILQAKIIERDTLHEWPLSCVEQLVTSEGTKRIYKSQFGPTVEARFYAKGRSKLLVSGQTLYTSETGHTNMLFEFVEGPLIEDLALSDEAILTAGYHIIEDIAKIDGALPCYLDISSETKWGALMEKMLDNLMKLTTQGIFELVNPELVNKLKKWIFCKEVMAALTRNTGFVHHDLSGDNIFVLPDGYRVIDWQRPILGPRELDIATLLDSLNKDPLRYIDEGIVWILYLMRIEWFTECAVRWFPDGRDSYDKSIAQLVSFIGKTT